MNGSYNGWTFKDGVLSNRIKRKPDGKPDGHGTNLKTKRADFFDFNYTKAIEYLDKTSVSSEIIGAGVYSLKGDCYANLNKLNEAISEYENAVSKADGNPTITPFVLIKMANIYAQQQNYAKEYECYSTIRTDYQAYVQQAASERQYLMELR